jgi:hypothetical protein
MLDVIGIISEISPRITITVFYQSGINSCDIGKRIDVRDIGAKVEEVIAAVSWIPVELLPSACRIIQWSSNYQALAVVFGRPRYSRGNAIVAAKSLMSFKASSPKIDFSFLIAWSSPVATKLSIFSIMALMLATQSCGPYF